MKIESRFYTVWCEAIDVARIMAIKHKRERATMRTVTISNILRDAIEALAEKEQVNPQLEQ